MVDYICDKSRAPYQLSCLISFTLFDLWHYLELGAMHVWTFWGFLYFYTYSLNNKRVLLFRGFPWTFWIVDIWRLCSSWSNTYCFLKKWYRIPQNNRAGLHISDRIIVIICIDAVECMHTFKFISTLCFPLKSDHLLSWKYIIMSLYFSVHGIIEFGSYSVFII